LTRVAIDLTPLLPGGDNGGAKPLAMVLVRQLALAAPACEFVLLTQEKTHQELAGLDAPNVRRLCTTQPSNAPTVSRQRALTIRRLLLKIVPGALVEKLGRLYVERLDRAPAAESSVLRQLGADLLFCPFTGVLFYDSTVPVVSLVHDLQYLYYPEFFDAADRHERDRYFRHVCRVASRIVCVSEFTRSTVLKQTNLPPDRVAAVLSAPQDRLPSNPHPRSHSNFGEPDPYLLYPANFWRHKNHEMLLAAFGMYRARHPQSQLKLVLTGAPSPRRDELIEASRRMRLADRVSFPGHLPESEFAALLGGCTAMIFPSLFEGFGMPVLEAMAAGVPVLTSNLASLPEVAADAALLFDPRRPTEIVDAIARIADDAGLRAELIAKGRERVRNFPGPAQMAAGYLAVFEEALRDPMESPPAIHGVFSDGWTSGRMQVVFGGGKGPRRLTVKLKAPEWIPAAAVTIRVAPGGGKRRIARGEEAAIVCELPDSPGAVELLCAPTFQPGGEDRRTLGCMLVSAAIGDIQLKSDAAA
jgi:glycosyltransferase involved in cell wall biosynthesis